MKLGQGSYGEVTSYNGKAIKKFSKLSHLIQEYVALKYLDDCQYVVHSKDVNFDNLELSMELYDSSLRNWLENNQGKILKQETMNILHDILLGLIEFHDRGLAHGDIKPSNILVKKRVDGTLKVVLGDCGFVSIAEYAKVDRTASMYRDPIISHDSTHDMFSFGICFLEMIGGIRINKQASYLELEHIIVNKIVNPKYKKIALNLLQEDKSERFSARQLLLQLFNESPPKWTKVTTNHTECLNKEGMRKLIKDTSRRYKINRAQRGFWALCCFIDDTNLNSGYHEVYTFVTLMILSIIFGKSGFRISNIMELTEDKFDIGFIHNILEEMLSSRKFLTILLRP